MAVILNNFWYNFVESSSDPLETPVTPVGGANSALVGLMISRGIGQTQDVKLVQGLVETSFTLIGGRVGTSPALSNFICSQLWWLPATAAGSGVVRATPPGFFGSMVLVIFDLLGDAPLDWRNFASNDKIENVPVQGAGGLILGGLGQLQSSSGPYTPVSPSFEIIDDDTSSNSDALAFWAGTIAVESPGTFTFGASPTVHHDEVAIVAAEFFDGAGTPASTLQPLQHYYRQKRT